MYGLVQAVGSLAREGLKPLYAPHMVSFDVGPRLQDVGVAAKMNNWIEAFALFRRPLGFDVRDITITVGDDVASMPSSRPSPKLGR
jgi:hypothetical protein